MRLLNVALIINLDVKDNHEEAAIGGKLALDLCQKVRTCSLLDLKRASKSRQVQDAWIMVVHNSQVIFA